jgi:transcriptional regulator with XRE-family HTH domain
MAAAQSVFGSDWSRAVRRAFGQRVRAMRQHQGISQEELALKCLLDRSYVGQVERGERNLTLENIYRLADGLGTSPSSLLPDIDGALDLRETDAP